MGRRDRRLRDRDPCCRMGSGRRPRRFLIDFSMAELVASRFNEYLAAESLGVPYSGTRPVNDELIEAGGSLVALSPSTAAQRAAVAGLLADPALRGSATALVDEVHRFGVPATVVADSESLVDDEQLATFGIYVEVDHPEWGRRRIVGVPWRFVGEPAQTLDAPPRFGATAGYQTAGQPVSIRGRPTASEGDEWTPCSMRPNSCWPSRSRPRWRRRSRPR